MRKVIYIWLFYIFRDFELGIEEPFGAKTIRCPSCSIYITSKQIRKAIILILSIPM